MSGPVSTSRKIQPMHDPPVKKTKTKTVVSLPAPYPQSLDSPLPKGDFDDQSFSFDWLPCSLRRVRAAEFQASRTPEGHPSHRASAICNDASATTCHDIAAASA